MSDAPESDTVSYIIDKERQQKLCGTILRDYRVRNKYTQRAIGQYLGGISASTIQRYEKGLLSVRTEIIGKLSKLYNTSPSILMGYEVENVFLGRGTSSNDYTQNSDNGDSNLLFSSNCLEDIDSDMLGLDLEEKEFYNNVYTNRIGGNFFDKNVEVVSEKKIDASGNIYDLSIKVNDDAMESAGIRMNDSVLVNTNMMIDNGEVVVFSVGSLIYTRYFFCAADKVFLTAGSRFDKFESFVFNINECIRAHLLIMKGEITEESMDTRCQIIGRAVSVVRTL